MSGGAQRSPLELGRLSIVLIVPALVIAAVEVGSSTGAPAAASPTVEASTTIDAEPEPEPRPQRSSAASITIAATGEILPHPSVVEFARGFGADGSRRFDFEPIFGDLRPALTTADVAICHLEVPVAPDESQLSGYPSFGIPADIGPSIADAGWDRCSTASNHSNDKGTTGIVATIEALDGAGVGHAGTARSPEEAAAAPYSIVEGVVVAHFAYTWGFNASPPAEPWMADVIDPERILADAARARSSGADLVVVSLHWGTEYDTAGSDDQRQLATDLLTSPDIDLLIGHGPHVIQPVLEVDGEFALLSVGNLVANQGLAKPHTYDGMIAAVTFSRGAGEPLAAAPPVITPTWYDNVAGRVRDVDAALADPALSSLHEELQASRERTEAIVGSYMAPT